MLLESNRMRRDLGWSDDNKGTLGITAIKGASSY